jgi:putative ABC transport system permease protein
MEQREAFRLSLTNIRGHKMRNILAVMSVMIGIAAVIAVITMSTGIETALLDVLTKDFLRANTISVSVEGSQGLFGADRVFTDHDVAEVEKIEGITAVDVFAPVNGNPLKYEGRLLPGSNVRIVTSDVIVPLDAGNFVDATSKGEIVLGWEIATIICERIKKSDFDEITDEQEQEIETTCEETTREPELQAMILGKQVHLTYLQNRQRHDEDLTIVGLVKKSQFIGGANSYVSPLYHGYTEVVNQDSNPVSVYTGIIISAEEVDNVPAIEEELQTYFATYNSDARKLVGDDREIEVNTATDVVEEIQGNFAQFAGWLGGIAFVALLVGMIGIMNIMLVTVKERTKEIGVMKATGATRGGVLRLFLTECMLICVLGAVMGIVGGIGLSLLFNIVTAAAFEFDEPIQFVFVWPAYFASVITGIVVGVISGLYPAWQAARVNPIEALRYE